jgi:hypothetical protein
MKKTGKEKKELMELKHDALPGYKPAFMTVFSISCSYMAYVLMQPCF